MKEMLVGKINEISYHVSSSSLLGVSDGCCQKALVGESGMFRTQMLKHNN
jgi:hypothetical protein